MATPYATGSPQVVGIPPQPAGVGARPTPQWYDQQNKQRVPPQQESSNLRSVTPAMNNTRGAAVRNGTEPTTNGGATYPARGGPSPAPSTNMANGGSSVEAHYSQRAATPNRYLGAYNSPEAGANQSQDAPQPPSSTGLIRLTLRKPMGIVFEPMYDANNPSVQRGVRICDLPRTGAAALSRKLEVGDELLSINDKTMSRLTFDEIMDFIIEADPEEVNLLFRRPRKEMLAKRPAGKTTPGNPNSTSGVKWVDDDQRNKKKDKKKTGERKTEKKPRRSKKEEEDTVQSTEDEYRTRARKKSRSRKDPYESESFLDILIDTICANPDAVCRDRRRVDDEYYSDDDSGTFGDDSTYVTYESEEPKRKDKNRSKGQNRDDDSSSTYEETEEDIQDDKRKRKNKREKDSARSSPPTEQKQTSSEQNNQGSEKDGKYEDDGTLESVDSNDRPKPVVTAPPSPLGLAPAPPQQEQVVPQVSVPQVSVPQVTPALPPAMPTSASEDDGNPAPIKEVEYDERVDHGADVSVMESLGGPSLLIEKQRQAAIAASRNSESVVPPEIINNFGIDYPAEFGLTREQTIQNDPIKFYTYVVRNLLNEHEPEKVRLLDKLLAKYKGREDHLVQKLSVRYNKPADEGTPTIPEEEEGRAFMDAVTKGKEAPATAAVVQTAKERLHTSEHEFQIEPWPEKETKEPEMEDEEAVERDESDSGSEYSGDSIDGTSPAVIAQVSELLNYVYGKTSVSGQIDRVSTIMRAYEGREAVLLELLETKALIKANGEKENAANLPSFLRNSPAMQRAKGAEIHAADVPPVTPMAQPQAAAGNVINDDISSMSGVSSPAEGKKTALSPPVSHEVDEGPTATSTSESPFKVETKHPELRESSKFKSSPTASPSSKLRPPQTPDRMEKKKKKGLFGGLFGGKKVKKARDNATTFSNEDSTKSGIRNRGMRSPKARKLKNMTSAEGSI